MRVYPSSGKILRNTLTTFLIEPAEKRMDTCLINRTDFVSGNGFLYIKCTVAPRPLKIPENSTAMYPPPMIATTVSVFRSSNVNASSDVMQKS